MLAEIAGLPAVSLQPAAGAQGELAALLTAAAYFRDRGEDRTQGDLPQQRSRHESRQCGARRVSTACNSSRRPTGLVDLDELEAQLDERTAVFMITNPNTLGLFERQTSPRSPTCCTKSADWFTSTGRT